MFRLWFRLTLFCLLLAVSGLAAAGQTVQSAPPEISSRSTVLAQASALLSVGKTDAALEILLGQAKSDPENQQIKYLLGLGYYQKADYARAIENLSSSVKRMPQNSPQYRQGVQMLGLSHYLLGHVKDALPYLEQLGAWSPEKVEISYTLGLSYIQTRQPEQARAAFARMFKVEPASAAAYLINAQMMIRQRFEELAEKELRQAVALDPKLPQAHFLLGEIAIYHADIALGIELLQKEIAVNPAFGMAYYSLGEAYTRQLKWDEAIVPLQKSIWLNPYFSGPYIALGKVYLKKADLVNAENILRRALQMDPNNYSGHHLLAQVFQQANRPEEARKEFALAEQLRGNAERDK